MIYATIANIYGQPSSFFALACLLLAVDEKPRMTIMTTRKTTPQMKKGSISSV